MVANMASSNGRSGLPNHKRLVIVCVRNHFVTDCDLCSIEAIVKPFQPERRASAGGD